MIPLQTLLEAFEDVVERNGLEKIKAIGDCFIAASGLPTLDSAPVDRQHFEFNSVRCGLQMIDVATRLKVPWKVRVGIHVGQLIAGKIGKKKADLRTWKHCSFHVQDGNHPSTPRRA